MKLSNKLLALLLLLAMAVSMVACDMQGLIPGEKADDKTDSGNETPNPKPDTRPALTVDATGVRLLVDISGKYSEGERIIAPVAVMENKIVTAYLNGEELDEALTVTDKGETYLAFMFRMPAGDAKLSFKVEERIAPTGTFKVTVAAKDVTLKEDISGMYTPFTALTLYAVPESGYDIRVTVNNKEITGVPVIVGGVSYLAYSFTVPVNNVAVSVIKTPVVVDNGWGTERKPLTPSELIAKMKDFADNQIGTEIAYVTGTVSSVSYSEAHYSYTLNLENGFQIYSAKLDGAEAPAVGATVSAYGYPKKFVKDGAATYEISYLKDTESPTGEEISPVIYYVKNAALVGWGSRAEPLTVADLLRRMADFTDNQIGTELACVTGLVRSVTYDLTKDRYSVVMDGGNVNFQIYDGKLSGSVVPEVGDTVSVCGYPQKYVTASGTTYEIPYLSAAKSPSGAESVPDIYRVEKGTVIPDTGWGTEKKPLTESELTTKMKDFADNQVGTEIAFVTGKVKSLTYSAVYSSYTIILEGGFQIYSGKLACLTEPEVGSTVSAYGYTQKYVKNDGTIIYEIPYLKASLSPTGEEYSPSIYQVVTGQVVPPDPPKPVDGMGTAEKPLTVSEAISVMTSYSDNQCSTEIGYVTGKATAVTFDSVHNSYSVWLETESGNFQFYSAVLGSGLEVPKEGAIVTGYGYFKKFVKNGSVTYEVAFLKAAESPSGADNSPMLISVINPAPDPGPVGEYTDEDGTVYTLIQTWGGTSLRVVDFELDMLQIHIVGDGVDQYVEVTESMLTAADKQKLASAGSYVVTVYYSQDIVLEIEITLVGSAIYTNDFDCATYYADAENKSGKELKLALRVIISKVKKSLSYGDLRTYLQQSDAGTTKGTIRCFYTHKDLKGAWDSGTTWNREHVWPQSKGWFTTGGAGADIHHIRATATSANGSRGNTAYGESSPYYYPNQKKSDEGTADDVRGDVARIIFYMLVRYSESESYTVEGTDGVCQSIDMLLRWNAEDAVDSFEIQRNNVGYSIQGNRNPFIDCPTFADLIWGNAA